MSGETEFAALYSRARHGDRDAFGILIDSLRPILQVYVERHTGPAVRGRAVPDDIVQSVFLALCSALPKYPERLSEGQLLARLQKLAHWKIQALLEKRAEASESAITLLDPAAALPGTGPVTRDDEVRRLLRAIDSLHPTSREVVRLRVLEGLEISEIATRLGISRGAVKKRLARAQQELVPDPASAGRT